MSILICLPKQQITQHGGKYFINPGSITGAYSPMMDPSATVTPSFILLSIQGSQCTSYVYELKGGEIEVSKTDFSKGS